MYEYWIPITRSTYLLYSQGFKIMRCKWMCIVGSSSTKSNKWMHVGGFAYIQFVSYKDMIYVQRRPNQYNVIVHIDDFAVT